MADHSDHPDVHTHGLADGCQGCWEHAHDPFAGLDESTFGDLVDLALLGSERLGQLRSTNEGIAAAKILTTMERFGRIARTRPAGTVEYLERWGVHATLDEVQA